MNARICKDAVERLAFRVENRQTIERLLAIRGAYGRTDHGERSREDEEQLRHSLAHLVDTLVSNEYHKISRREYQQRVRRVQAESAKELFKFDRDARMSTRLASSLVDHGVEKLEDVLQYSEEELLRWKNFGVKTLRELKTILAEHGLALRAHRADPPTRNDPLAESGENELPHG